MVIESVMQYVGKKRGRTINAQALAIQELVRLETKVKGLLTQKPNASVLHSIGCHAFTRQVYSLKRKHLGGGLMAQEIEVRIAGWKVHGLDEKILRRIVRELFSPM
jgi:hypothetical protein